MEDPVAYGRQHRPLIQALQRIADLPLQTFSRAGPQVQRALHSDTVTVRYWAATAAAAFGHKAAALLPDVRQRLVVETDVPVRAVLIEFLGLLDAEDPRPLLAAALRDCDERTEALVLLNVCSHFRFLHPDWTWDIGPEDVPEEWLRMPYTDKPSKVSRLLDYLQSAT